MNLRMFAHLAMFTGSSLALADSGVDQEYLNRSLRQAALSGGVAEVRELVNRGADLNSKAPFGETALLDAIVSGRLPVAMELVRLGADPNIADDWGISPLIKTAEDCNGSRVAQALIGAGADVNHSDSYGQTALMKAAHSDCERTVAVILLNARDKIKLDVEDDSLQTADSLAQSGFVPEMIEMVRKYQHGSKQALRSLLKLK